MGIITDRETRRLFMPRIEAWAEKATGMQERLAKLRSAVPHAPGSSGTMELEKFIRVHSEALLAKIDYNRSRLRICRSWILNFFLIGVSFLAWNARVRIVSSSVSLLIFLVDLLFVLLALRTTLCLAKDYQIDLVESLTVILQRRFADTEAGHGSSA